ncbi:MAG: hypothetical protein ACJ74Z_09910 [Bryobacteraceae bacterium]
MRSSISSSETDAATAPVRTANTYRVWSVCALASVALFCVGMEVLARFGFNHVSRIEARIANDHAAVLAIRKSETPSVLLLGNSLLLADIDYVRLRDSLRGQAHTVRFPIEETEYLDWFYGLRRFFSEGSRPDMVVLCMNAQHLTSSKIRGDYSVYYLFRFSDIPQIRRAIGYDLTQTCGLALSRFSLFYAARNNLRNFVLFRTAQAYIEMLQNIAAPRAHVPSDQDVERTAETRLTALRTLCSSYGAQFVFLLPPGFGQEEAPLVRAGMTSRTDVMVPVHLNALKRDQFKDGLHLNFSGAEMFTDKVLARLKTRLEARQTMSLNRSSLHVTRMREQLHHE